MGVFQWAPKEDLAKRKGQNQVTNVERASMALHGRGTGQLVAPLTGIAQTAFSQETWLNKREQTNEFQFVSSSMKLPLPNMNSEKDG